MSAPRLSRLSCSPRFSFCCRPAIGLSISPMIEVCLGLTAAALLAAACLWLLRAPGRWVTAFLVAAVALPPLPIAIGGSGPHPALLVALVGLVAGLLFVRFWRIPADSLSRAL